MKQSPKTYAYGPVPSRRLGRSLGVDLVPFKTCSYDCLYCQLGRTTNKTIARREYIPVNALVASVEEALRTAVTPDYITLAGSGEPTLHSGLGAIIAAIKKRTTIPVAVITNGSLLWDPDVRQELLGADVVLPSLDAGDAALFERINRPHAALSFDRMVEGLTTFVREFPGQVWLEIMLLADSNSTPSAVAALAELVGRIKPDRLHLNSVFRPAPDTAATCCSLETLRAIAPTFPGQVTIVSEPLPNDGTAVAAAPDREAAILSLLERRPCSLADIATGLGLHPAAVLKTIDRLLQGKRLEATTQDDVLFYTIRRSDNHAP